MKILLCCYGCSPYKGSEPGMGWAFAKHISENHKVHVIFGEKQEQLMGYVQAHAEECKNMTFHYIARKEQPLLRKIWPPSYYWSYDTWQKKALRLAEKLHEQEHFDLVHQVTLAGYRCPGYLWKLGIPFVWGPFGGLVNTPWILLRHLDLYSKLLFTARNIYNWVQKRCGYAARTVSQKASAIMVIDERAADEIRVLWGKEALSMRELGVNASQIRTTYTHRPQGAPLRLLWVGALMSFKGLHMLLEALPQVTVPVELHVMGKGGMLKEWQKKAARLGIADKVVFHGYVQHEEALCFMQSCHALCITSIKEGGTSTVTLEALQNGMPVIALDHCGYASALNDSCSIRIPIRSYSQIVQDFAAAINRIGQNEALRSELAQGALRQSHQFTWEEKMRTLNAIYDKCVAESTRQ